MNKTNEKILPYVRMVLILGFALVAGVVINKDLIQGLMLFGLAFVILEIGLIRRKLDHDI